jgi:hypothetical protein
MPVCWQCGGINYFKRNCRQWYPLKYSPEESQPRNGGGDNFNTCASSLSTQRVRKAWPWQSTHQGMDMRESRSSDRRLAGYQHWTARVCPADGIRGDTPLLKGSFHKTDSAVALTNNLSVHPQYHISQMTSSWDSASSMPMMYPRIWGATCYDYVMRKCHCGALGREAAAARYDWVAAVWLEDSWRQCIASQGWVPGPSIKLKYVGREHRFKPQWRCL